MRLFIEPTDVWLFRDGKPFDAGSDHRAQSLFPPNPSTLQGALRGKLFSMTNVSRVDFLNQSTKEAQALAQKIGKPGGAPPFGLRGPFLARREDTSNIVCYLPVPADVVKVRDEAQVLATEKCWQQSGTTDVAKVGNELRVLQPLKQAPFTFNEPVGPATSLALLWARTDKPLEVMQGWLDIGALRACLNGQPPPLQRVKRDAEFFTRESRFGVGIESDFKRHQEGLLYQVEYIRPRDNVGLAIEVGTDFPKSGLLALGGESRAARYEEVELALPNACRPESDRFKLYFATPAYLECGWQSPNWNKLLGGKVDLIAAAMERAQSLGGWDVANNWNKVMRRYVPAGSVFYFQAKGRIEYDGRPVTDDEQDGKIGYGQVLFGTWDYLDA